MPVFKDKNKKGITFIGLPGSGKSTMGRILANKLRCNYIDLDILIFKKEGVGHHEILKQKGESELKRLEEKYALELDFNNLIFSPGGSMVYSSSVMEKIKNESAVVYLVASAEDIKKRLGKRLYKDGIIGLETKGLENVVKERLPLYEKYADFSITTSGLSPEIILDQILKQLDLNDFVV